MILWNKVPIGKLGILRFERTSVRIVLFSVWMLLVSSNAKYRPMSLDMAMAMFSESMREIRSERNSECERQNVFSCRQKGRGSVHNNRIHKYQRAHYLLLIACMPLTYASQLRHAIEAMRVWLNPRVHWTCLRVVAQNHSCPGFRD